MRKLHSIPQEKKVIDYDLVWAHSNRCTSFEPECRDGWFEDEHHKCAENHFRIEVQGSGSYYCECRTCDYAHDSTKHYFRVFNNDTDSGRRNNYKCDGCELSNHPVPPKEI